MEYVYISSRKNDKIIYASKLRDKKFRDKEGVFAAEGSKLLEEGITEGLNFVCIYFTKNALDRYSSLLEKANADEYVLVTDEVYEKLTEETSPQGIFSVITKPVEKCFSDKELSEGGFLILEDVQNPLNIGALFRCAFSLGMSKIVLSHKCADVYNSKVLRSAMGSVFKADFIYCDDLHSFIQKQLDLNNRVICTTLSEKSHVLGDFTFQSGDSIIIGNEGNGISEDTVTLCKNSIIIPMLPSAESLNAATACSVVLWEMNKDKLLSIHKEGENADG